MFRIGKLKMFRSRMLKDDVYRWDAAKDLARSSRRRAVRLLANEYPSVREIAARSLGELGDARAVEPLIVALDDPDSGVRRNVAEALGKLGWRPENDSQRARLAIVAGDWDEVVGLGSAAVEPLIQDAQRLGCWGAQKARRTRSGDSATRGRWSR